MKKGKKWLAIVLAVAILGTLGVGAALADNSSKTVTQSSQGLYQAYLSNLASALGIDQAALTNAMQTASNQMVDQELQSGKITQQQADQIKSRISKGTPFFGFVGKGPGGPGSVAGSVYSDKQHGFRAGGGFMVLKPLADALGMDQKDVISDLKSGKTVSDLAATKSLAVEQLQSTILTSIKSQLDKSVSDGKMTADQESQVYSKLEQSISSGDWIAQLQKIGQAGDHQQPPTN